MILWTLTCLGCALVQFIERRMELRQGHLVLLAMLWRNSTIGAVPPSFTRLMALGCIYMPAGSHPQP